MQNMIANMGEKSHHSVSSLYLRCPYHLPISQYAHFVTNEHKFTANINYTFSELDAAFLEKCFLLNIM